MRSAQVWIQQTRSDGRNERKEALASLERELPDDLKSVEAALHEHRDARPRSMPEACR